MLDILNEPESLSKRTLGLSDKQRIDWLRLIRSENVGSQTFFSLLNHYGSASSALEALPDLSKRGGMARQIQLCSLNAAEKEYENILKFGASLIAIGEDDYPYLLREINAPPPLITIKGETRGLKLPSLAIVGSRNASSLGLKMAANFARDLAQNGFFVVSGLARGIDAVAHKASLAFGTVGIMAGGINMPYPKEHEGLIQDILSRGCVITEMPFNHEPRAKDFPRRNRIISGMTMGTLVIEAAERSGTLITARLANEEGREVFALPGSPLDPRSVGTNRLIKQGATMITSSDELIDLLKPMLGLKPRIGFKEPLNFYEGIEPNQSDRSRVLNLLSASPIPIDDLTRDSGLESVIVQTILIEFSLAGKIEQDVFGIKRVY